MSYKDVPDTIINLDEKLDTSLDTSQNKEEEIKPFIEFKKSFDINFIIQSIEIDLSQGL